MADYTTSKGTIGALEPTHAVATPFDRLEPLITPAQLKIRFLLGIPLVSNAKDPRTNKAMEVSNEMIDDFILRAVSMVETDTHIDVFPVQRKEKHPYDRNFFNNFSYMVLEHKPVSSLEELAIVPADNQTIFHVPLEWVEVGLLEKGQINLVPITAAFGGSYPSMSGSGSWFVSVLGQRAWIPGFWQVTYTSGYPDGQLPRVINELIGIYAAQDILSSLGATYGGSTSHSLSHDSISQSVSTPGGQIYAQRIQDLEAKRVALLGKIKSRYGFKMMVSTL